MALDKYRENVQVGENKYRIGRLPAAVGVWVADMIANGSVAMGPENYARVQRYLLSACQVYVQDMPTALYSYEADKWLVKGLDIEEDIALQDELKTEAIDFNFTGFYKARAARFEKVQLEREAKLAESKRQS